MGGRSERGLSTSLCIQGIRPSPRHGSGWQGGLVVKSTQVFLFLFGALGWSIDLAPISLPCLISTLHLLPNHMALGRTLRRRVAT